MFDIDRNIPKSKSRIDELKRLKGEKEKEEQMLKETRNKKLQVRDTTLLFDCVEEECEHAHMVSSDKCCIVSEFYRMSISREGWKKSLSELPLLERIEITIDTGTSIKMGGYL